MRSITERQEYTWPRKKPPARPPTAKKPVKKVNLTARDKKTLGSLTGLADGVVRAAAKRREPAVDIPSRTLSNVRYSPRKRIIEMGSGTNRRQLFDLSQAKAYMRTMLVASGCKRLIDEGKTTSLRGLFYMLKHTIEGTKENTFDEQNECDSIIEDSEVLLDSLREELHLYAENRGAMVGSITFTDKGDEINCARMGSGGYAIPSICEPEVIQARPPQVRCQVRPARRKRYRLATLQRGSVLGEAQLHPHPRLRPAPPRRPAAACTGFHNELQTARLLRVG